MSILHDKHDDYPDKAALAQAKVEAAVQSTTLAFLLGSLVLLLGVGANRYERSQKHRKRRALG